MAEFIVHKIVWKQDSPYGTYLQDDEVEIYWDDVAEDFVVYVNGGVETSGNDIPFFFTYSGQPDTYYKIEEHYYALICTTADAKVETFRAISAFPYLTAVELPDHPSCAASPAVCDLSFSSLPTVVNATDSVTADGEITVTATSSNGAIEYSIGSDFVYGSGVATGAFTTLLPGDYTIYARDAINCFAEITVSVGIAYSYGALLRIEFIDFLGNDCKVEILEKDYSGAVTEVDGADYNCFFINLRGEGEDDKFKPIISTESLINFISSTDFQFIDLFTGDPEKYRVTFSRDEGSGYEIKVTHKLLPNQYTEEYKASPYAASFVAVDGTANLKDKPFADDLGGRLYGTYDQIALIAFCLKKIGLGLNIRCAVNLYATGMSSGATNDPLDQAYVDVETYYLAEENPSCDFVIRAILEPYGAQLIMWNNTWNILRVEERVASFDYRQFDEDGVYSSNSSYSPVKDIESTPNSSSLLWMAHPSLKMMPGFGTVLVNYNLGLNNNILKNGDFKLKQVYNSLLGFNQILANTDGFLVVHNSQNVDGVSYETVSENNVAIKLVSNNSTYILSDSYSVKMSFSDRLKFRVRYKTPVVYRDYPYQKIRAKLVYGSYYLQSDGFWSGSDNTLVYYSKEFGKYTDFEVVARQPDASALAGLNLYCIVYSSSVFDTEFTTLAGLRAKTTTSLPLATRTELLPSSTGSGVDTAYIYYFELENNTDAESVPDIVRPTDYHVTTNPVQWILKKQLTSTDTQVENFFYIDSISVEYLPEGKEAPKTFNTSIDAESNNPEPFEKDLYHGSLTNDITTSIVFNIPLFGGVGSFQEVVVGTENADKIYKGYLRTSGGTGYTTWSRDAIPESRLLHEIYLRTISGQYSRPWRKLIGGAVSDSIYFSPIDTIRETLDSNRFYYPISLQIDVKRNQYSGEFVEILDVTDSDEGSGSGVGFTTGFTVGFDA